MNDTVRLVTEWRGCYDGGWQGEIVPEAFAHPAKVSRALIRHIYAHAFEEGWLSAGDVVVDPFGGIAGTALDAMWNGLTWVGCELEPKFVGLAGENIEQWSRRYGSKPGFGSARILRGDSRKLGSVIAGVDCCIGSPPFADSLSNKPSAQILAGSGGRMGESCKSDDYYGTADGQLGAMPEGTAPALICSSPPYAAIATGAGGLNTKPGADGQQSGRSASTASQSADQRYGESAGQLAVMRGGEAPAIIISSPPFASQQTGGGIAAANGVNGNVRTGTNCGYQNQAESAGNLGSMPEGRFDAVVGSPPFEAGAEGGVKAGKFRDPESFAAGMSARGGRGNSHAASPGARAAQFKRDAEKIYGDAEGNIGNQTGDTFWQAAREIVAQCHAILRPGGHAIWITKRFVRKGKIVEFSDQWVALCQQEGFELVCRHRAMLVANHGTQHGLFGEDRALTTARKSFFRRLAEKNGSPAIDYEDVLCLIKR